MKQIELALRDSPEGRRSAKLFDHFSEVPNNWWPYRYFTPGELACKGTGSLLVDFVALGMLDELRKRLGHPLVVTSAYRSHEHNKKVGGHPSSLHLQGRAFDIAQSSIRDVQQFMRTALDVGFRGFGHASNFIHIDDGPSRTWNYGPRS